MNLAYLWSKLLRKARLSAVASSTVPKTSKIESGSHVVNSTFGRHSFCGYDCAIYNCDVGDFCSIANDVKIGGGAHPMNWVSMSPVFYEGRDSVKAKFSTHKRMPASRVRIGHDVWIGEGAMIKQGVTVGTGAVVGMGSVVTRDVEDYSVVAGVPARSIGKRFDDDTIAKLLDSEWWKIPDEDLKTFAQYFMDPERFIEEIERQ